MRRKILFAVEVFVRSEITLKRLTAASEGLFTGLASNDEADRQGERVLRSAYRRSIEAFRAGRLVLPVLLGHDKDVQIGSVVALEDTPDGLVITAQLALGTPEGARVFELMKAGHVPLSVGFLGAKKQQGHDGVTEVIDLDLAEVSVVGIGANRAAGTRSVKAAQRFPTRRDLEHAARDALGLSSREAKRLAAGGWSALTANDSDPDDDEMAALAARLAAVTHSLRTP
jgi:HK97 family phage prohead protease